MDRAESVVLARLLRAELVLCTGCGSATFHFEALELVHGHEASLLPLSDECFSIPEGLPAAPDEMTGLGLETLTTEGCSAVYSGQGPLYLLGAYRTGHEADFGGSEISWFVEVESPEFAEMLLATNNEVSANEEVRSAVGTSARREALGVFAHQRMAEQPGATFSLAEEPEESGNTANLTVWLSLPDAECADSLWRVTLVDVDSGVAALDRAERVGRLCCADSCAREPIDWMLALNTMRESDPEAVAGMVHPERGVTIVETVGDGVVHTRDDVSLDPGIVPSWSYQRAEVTCEDSADGFGCSVISNDTRIGIEWAEHEGAPHIVAVEIVEWE